MRFLNWESVAFRFLVAAKKSRVPEERYDYFVKCMMGTLKRDTQMHTYLPPEFKGPWFSKFVVKDAEEGKVGTINEFTEYGSWAIDVNHLADWCRDLPEDQLRIMEGHQSLKGLQQAARQWYKAKKKADLLPKMRGGTEHVCQSDAEHEWVALLSSDAYANEGRAMGHCVGGYYGKPDSKVFSLRDKEGWPHLSAETSSDGKHLYQTQGRSGNKNYMKHLVSLSKALGFNIAEREGRHRNAGYEYNEDYRARRDAEHAKRKVSPGFHVYKIAPTAIGRQQRGIVRNRKSRIRNDNTWACWISGWNWNGSIRNPGELDAEAKALFMVPEASDVSLLPRSIYVKYLNIGGPLSEELLSRVVDRKEGLFLHIKDANGVQIPKRNWKIIVLSNSRGVKLPRGYKGPLMLINATIASRRYIPPVMDRVDQFVSWAANQGGNHIDSWYWRQEYHVGGAKIYEASEMPKYPKKPKK